MARDLVDQEWDELQQSPPSRGKIDCRHNQVFHEG